MSQERIDQALIDLGFTSETEYKAAKSKRQQPETPNDGQGRDLFQTPKYAIDLLVPFLKKTDGFIWECACGEGKIVYRLREHKFQVYATDIRESSIVDKVHNFLTDDTPIAILDALDYVLPVIVTNPPFSLKQKFYERCRKTNAPFALLIPADYSGWIIQACIDGAEKIIPTRRIDYITPSGLSGASGHTADFHSLWLTWGFNLGKTETFVELSLEDKKNNI